MTTDMNKITQLRQPAEQVLNYGLEKLRNVADIKRASLWNQIQCSENLVERGFLADLTEESRGAITSEFILARLLLATAANVNHDQPAIVRQFSGKELALIQNMEKFNVFDILSVEEIADRMDRKKDLRNLALDFYQNEFNQLDDLLDSPEIQKNLKIAFNLRYRDRLHKVVQGIQAYISKYGIPDTVAQMKEGLQSINTEGKTA
jgi:hypothetical protein